MTGSASPRVSCSPVNRRASTSYITDPTPIDEFYILQAGKIVIAGAPAGSALVAENP
jgi:hypothetical protein